MVRRRRGRKLSAAAGTRLPITARTVGRVQSEWELARELEDHARRSDGLYGVLTAIAKLDADEKASARRLYMTDGKATERRSDVANEKSKRGRHNSSSEKSLGHQHDGGDTSKALETAILDYYIQREDSGTRSACSGSPVDLDDILDHFSGDELDVFSDILSLNDGEPHSEISDAIQQNLSKNISKKTEAENKYRDFNDNSSSQRAHTSSLIKPRRIKSAIRKQSEQDETKSAVTFDGIDMKQGIPEKDTRTASEDCRTGFHGGEYGCYERQVSAYSTTSGKSVAGTVCSNHSTYFRRKISSAGRESHVPRDGHAHKSMNFDPELDKATKFLHGTGGKTFSGATTTLMPMKYGLQRLQTCYTETNLEHNPNVVFLDLLKTSHQTSELRCNGIRNIEKRLEVRRMNPLCCTSFYEHKNLVDPFHRQTKTTVRTVAQKKKARKEKIKKMTDELHTGYVPTQLTMKIADRDEVEDIGKNVRYLRCNGPVQQVTRL